MAEIKPLRAWRYNTTLSQKIDKLTSPLFDVVSEKQRFALYDYPYNSIHLSVPIGERPAENALRILRQWKKDGVIVQDPVPSIYVYYQYFTLPGHVQEFCRKGFICNIRLYEWDDNVILRHENTMPKSVNDRSSLLAKTELNVSATHGLFFDDSFELEPYMDRSMQHPVYHTEDYQGVRDVLSVIQDKDIINRFVAKMKDKRVILADGHHRYAGALDFRKAMMTDNPHHNGDEEYNFHLMYLTNTESDDLRILPTHRLIKGLDNFNESAILDKMHQNFTVEPLTNACDIDAVILGRKWTFGVLFKENAYRIRLKPEVFASMRWNLPAQIKNLDLTVMHYFIIEDILGIPGALQNKSECIEYQRNFPECLSRVVKSEAQMALITRNISINDVKTVCHSGCTMPTKSTFFYPKVVCGFVFGSIREGEN